MANDDYANVYWCARDLDSGIGLPGNHHFILVMYADKATAQKVAKQCDLSCQTEEKGDKIFYFSTLGGFAGDEGKTQLGINNTADIKSVREWLDPNEHTSFFLPDYDLESHLLDPGARNKLNADDKLDVQTLVKLIAESAHYYSLQELKDYDLLDANCATWVNSLMRAIGFPAAYRIAKSEFAGFDWGEEDLLPVSSFRKLD